MIGRMAIIETNYPAYSKKARDYVIKYHNQYDWEKNWLEVICLVNGR
jgi:hypothetical protein